MGHRNGMMQGQAIRRTRSAANERGQALIEYAILAVTIGIAGAVLFPIITGKLSAGYTNSNSAIQADWEPCPPGGCP